MSEHTDEYVAFLEAQMAKSKTGYCPNCNAAIRPLHCCACEGCDGCREQDTGTPPETPSDAAMRAAEEWLKSEWAKYYGGDFDEGVKALAAIITRYLVGTPALETPATKRSNHFSDAAIDKGFSAHISRDGTAHYSDGTVLPPVVATDDVEGERCQRRPWPCRYRDARQCAHDTMLGTDCPRVCDCPCHAAAAAAALRTNVEGEK